MPNIDTSQNRDPSPTADELLNIRDRMLARLEAGEPVRIIRSANLRTAAWRQDAGHLARKWATRAPYSPEIARCETLADTGEHLGIERVGLILERRP